MQRQGARQQLAQPKPAFWETYFPQTAYEQEDRRAKLVQQLQHFYCSDSGRNHLVQLTQISNDQYTLLVDYVKLRDESAVADLVAALQWQPVEALKCIAAAAAEAAFGSQRQRLLQLCKEEELFPGQVTVQLHNCSDFATTIRNLKSSSIGCTRLTMVQRHSSGKLVVIHGTVVRMSVCRSLLTGMDFVCGKCGASQRVLFEGGRYSLPTSCQGGHGCRSKTFAPDFQSATSEDWQKIRIQPHVVQEVGGEDVGRVPRTVEVELRGPLVDSCLAGDTVTVVGIVNVLSAEQPKAVGGPRTKQSHTLFLLYLDAVSISNPQRPQRLTGRQQPGSIMGSHRVEDQAGGKSRVEDGAAHNFSIRDLQFVVKLSEEFEGQQLQLLVQSLCPTIYGQEYVKLGLLLALLGGVQKQVEQCGSVPVRGDIHVLLVGDPGLGKSQMLQAACACAPRGVYICGNTATSAGLTVSVVRDPLTGAPTFEAGAVVLADGGVCCVDEFDKMTSEHQALLGAMEQQEVAVAKAGLVASLPARTAILAAANPQAGHYQRAKTVAENLKMSIALLSRFDLLFIMLDKPDEHMDAKLSEHVMALHSGVAGRAAAAKQGLLNCGSPAPLLLGAASQAAAGPGRVPLLHRLREQSAVDSGPLPPQLLKKYISYARAYCHPVLSEPAKAVLHEFYVQLRKSAVGSDGIPITTRQLESMVRLAEARARLELREVVTKDDALVVLMQDVVELMKESLYDIYLDENGTVDFRRAGGKSKQAEAKRFLGALARRAEARQQGDLFTVAELYDVADELEINVPNMAEFIEQLNDAGELLKKGHQQYQVRCAAGSSQRQGSQLTATSQRFRC